MLLLSIFLILILFGFLNRRSNVVSFSLFVITWILLGWNNGNADFENYQIRYENSAQFLEKVNFFSESGFSFLTSLGYNAGIDYLHFKIIISFCCLLLVFRVIYKYAYHHTLVIASYCLFLFVLDVTQIRNFIAFSIVLSAIPLLFRHKLKFKILYVLLVLVAGSIHIASLFYLIFVFADKELDRKKLVLGILVFFLIKSLLYSYLSAFVIKLDAYKDLVSPLGFLMYVSIQIINLIYIIRVNKQKKHKRTNPKITKTTSNLIVNLNWLLLCLIPFYLDSINFTRLFRNLAILNFIFITNHLYFNSKNVTKELVLYIGYGLFFLLSYNLVSGNFEKIVVPVFYNNAFNLFNL